MAAEAVPASNVITIAANRPHITLEDRILNPFPTDEQVIGQDVLDNTRRRSHNTSEIGKTSGPVTQGACSRQFEARMVRSKALSGSSVVYTTDGSPTPLNPALL
jgi:hypothetical protein